MSTANTVTSLQPILKDQYPKKKRFLKLRKSLGDKDVKSN